MSYALPLFPIKTLKDVTVQPGLHDALGDIIRKMPQDYLVGVSGFYLKQHKHESKGVVCGSHNKLDSKIIIQALDYDRLIPIGFEGVVYHEVGHSVYHHLVSDDLKVEFDALIDKYGYPSRYVESKAELGYELYDEAFADLFSIYHARQSRIHYGIEHPYTEVYTSIADRILPHFERLFGLDYYIRLNESRLRGGALN